MASKLTPVVRSLLTNGSPRVCLRPSTLAYYDTFRPFNQSQKPVIKGRHTQDVFTIPNILTFSRIAVTPAVGYFIWNGMHQQALACFAFAATTDLLDGFIARKFNQDSDLGAVLDPVADKLLLLTCFFSMHHAGLLPFWIVKGFVMRDSFLLIGGTLIRYYGFEDSPSFKKFMDLKNYPTLGFEPTMLSKCNTALQCSIILLGLSTHHLAGMPIYDWSIFSLHCVTALTAVTSLIQYGHRFLADTAEAGELKSRTTTTS